MISYLCLSVQFLQPYYHGRGDGAEPEWPPSPLRLYQALVAAASRRFQEDQSRDNGVSALHWLEQQPTPAIAAVNGRLAWSKYRLYVPDNTGDLAAGAWSRGDATRIVSRTEKDIRPMHLPDFGEVHYLFPLTDDTCPHFNILCDVARSVTHLGWGVDLVVGNATVKTEAEVVLLNGEVWRPTLAATKTALRIPMSGTLDALITKHKAFLNRIGRDSQGNECFHPVPPLSTFRVVGYRRANDPRARPFIVFELRNDDGTRFRYPQDKLIHLAGMVRHLAIKLMGESPPEEVGNSADWVRSYVAGHRDAGADAHRQLSYLPLPSIGHAHVDPAVRRVMIAAPLDDDRLLQHLEMMLDGQQLSPTPETKLNHPPTLVRVGHDNIARFYTQSATNWASVTPVILPGHNDHKPDKTRKLIEKALQQSGIDIPCEYEWSAFSQFPKSLSAHRYDRDKRPTGYVRPKHLLDQTAIHLKLRFNDGVKVPGPLAIGAGRHCGLGLMASFE